MGERRTPETKKIRHLLLDLDISMTAIAVEYGCKPQAVWRIINGKSSSTALEKFIARKLRADVRELFPRDESSQAA